MKILQIPLLLGLMIGFSADIVYAQVAGETAAQAVAREQVKKDLDWFKKTHRFDAATENWVLRKEFEPPTGMKTRAQVRAERDEFFKTHKYDGATEAWVTIKGETKAAMSPAETKAELAQFLRTHEWDDISSGWVEKQKPKNSRVKKTP